MLLLLNSASAHSIQLHGHTRQCFFEDLKVEDKMTVSYQVADRGVGSMSNLEIDFWIVGPDQQVIESRRPSAGSSVEVEARKAGIYEYCFSDEAHHHIVGGGGPAKEVLFNVHGIIYVPADDAAHADPLENGIKRFGELLNQVKDEQEYIVVREMVHRNTAESTNSRVKWWSIFQLGVVAGNAIFQVWYLKRFFEVKRVV